MDEQRNDVWNDSGMAQQRNVGAQAGLGSLNSPLDMTLFHAERERSERYMTRNQALEAALRVCVPLGLTARDVIDAARIFADFLRPEENKDA